MAKKSIIDVKCPCCQNILEIDVEQERVLAHRKGAHLRDDARQGEDPLAVALRNQKETVSRSDAQFLRAQEDLKHQGDRLEQLFRDARKKAEETEDEPRGPDLRWD